ncbi:ABC transporter ATP-binding protein [Raoultibacter timonensis]|uniref:Peptide ABC transporter n=2 Tax=Raoultibacter timonensis TaxID=1907662 RepID=A0ABN6MG07_9ACTN|nr:ATP-binding cassette domain-containing protein [Raoultibacter timonensis]BDE95727.1 peptide ABC transporter [Raoultibacter timonensis]BDF50331.1 peptide ABC transporter [Raoultibacter timonensis]
MSVLAAEGVRYSYGKGAPVLDGVSLRVESGQRVALSAPSGTGKTTLARVLAGYLAPDEGRVTIDGRPLPRRGVCPVQMIWQHPEAAVDPRMRLGRTLAEAGPVDRALVDGLGIRDEWMDRFPHELSGGELQRFCIARALAAEPRFVIADEMSTMLDALTQAQIWRFLMDEVERREVGLVFVSHSPALTERIATDIVEL